MSNGSLEGNVSARLAEELRDRAEALLAAGLEPSPVHIESSGEGMDYRMELRVDFSDSSGIRDVIEFQVYDRGRAVATEEELASWISAALDDVLLRQR
jgi:hypothetical protein